MEGKEWWVGVVAMNKEKDCLREVMEDLMESREVNTKGRDCYVVASQVGAR